VGSLISLPSLLLPSLSFLILPPRATILDMGNLR